MHTQFADTSSRPEELSPTTLNEERNDNNKDMETDSVTAISSSPSTSPDPMLSSDSRSRTWIVVAVAVVALLIMAFVGIMITVCCIMFKFKARKRCPPSSESVHNYDYVDTHGIYSQAHGTMSPTVPPAIQRRTEEYDGTESLEYIHPYDPFNKQNFFDIFEPTGHT